MTTHHKIIVGDSRRMTELADESVHLVVTSPPYWQLKDYGHKGQLGFHDSYEEYINNLNLVWTECFRALHKGCRMCINIGDQFARSVYYGRYKVIPIRTEITRFCETLGMDFMGSIIWQKVTTTNTTGGATVMGSFPYPRNGIIKIDYEFILIFKKPGEPPKVDKDLKELSRLTTEEWTTYFAGHWNFGGERQDKHLAMFPEELPRRLVRMFTFVGDTVLDPFLGSGTTSLASKNLNRNSIGYEISDSFIPVIKNKLKTGHSVGDATFEFIARKEDGADFEKEIADLPYRFSDPHALDTKVDPHRLKFGSRIKTGDNEDRGALFSVKEVIGPTLLRLSNNSTVRLIGVSEKPSQRENAIEFLQTRLKGQRISLIFDKNKEDESGNLLAYVYLKNKTFINAHLARTGFVSVDARSDFKFREKFLSIEKDHIRTRHKTESTS